VERVEVLRQEDATLCPRSPHRLEARSAARREGLQGRSRAHRERRRRMDLERLVVSFELLMYSGRVERYKNVHRLANIVRILNTDFGMNLDFKIFGSGSFVDRLNKHLAEMGMQCRVSPPQPFEDYIESLSKASLFGLLSEKGPILNQSTRRTP